MPGWISFDQVKRPEKQWETLAGLLLFHITLPRECRPRHLRKAVRWARRQKIALIAADPRPWEDVPLARYGLSIGTPGTLCRRCASQLAMALLPDPGEATVVLVGETMTPDLTAAAQGLVTQVRQLVIAAPGGEALARALRLRYGMPVVEKGEGDLTVAFSPGERGGTCLDLSGDWPDLLGCTLRHPDIPMPEGLEGISLLSLLCRCGKVFPHQIAALSTETLDRLDQPTYNTG